MLRRILAVLALAIGPLAAAKTPEPAAQAGETLGEVVAGLDRFTTRVKAEVSPNDPFGVGLRLSAEAARELREPRGLEGFTAFLSERGLYVFTLNGFPYGRFHGERLVKVLAERLRTASAARY